MVAFFESVDIDVQRGGGQGMAETGRDGANVYPGGNQECGCGMTKAVEGDGGQLIF